MSQQSIATDRAWTPVAWLERRILSLSRHWLAWVNLYLGILVLLPWLAPVSMQIGVTRLARVIYAVYSPLCRQFANRSFFLFGPKLTYSYTDLLPYTPGAATSLSLKTFIGTPELGYKAAWSDRMVSMYGGILLGGLIFGLLRHRLKSLKWWGFALLTLPIVVNGITHMISDLAGVDQGFRYHNAWLVALTGDLLPQSFYVGTTMGSFNSWMRLVTGLLFGLAVVWMVYPIVEDSLRNTRQATESRLRGT